MFNLSKDDDVRHYVKIYGKKVEKVRGRAAAGQPPGSCVQTVVGRVG